MIQVMGMPEVVAPEEVLDVQNVTQLIMREREKRLNLTKEIIFQKQKNFQLENFIEDLVNSLQLPQEKKVDEELVDDTVKVGAYSANTRMMKIKKYKLKLKKYRSRVTISREFKGRSLASKMKPRLNGKFAKKTHTI